jgi:hypothetical protein
MGEALLLLLQAVSGPPVPLELREPVVRSAACSTHAEGGEIVVCGRTPERQRLKTLPEPAARSAQDALAFRLPGGGTGNVHAVQTNLPGATGPGAVLSLGIPFGKKAR